MPDRANQHSIDSKLRRTIGAARLSQTQHERHLSQLSTGTRTRNARRRKREFAEIGVIAAVALLVVATLVGWQRLGPDSEDDGLASVETPTIQGTETDAFEIVESTPTPEAPSAWNGLIYMFRDGEVVGIDAATGEIVQQLGIDVGSQSPLLAVAPEADRIAVADFLRNGDGVELGVMVFRMSDGSLLREIPVPTLIRHLGSGDGIAFSHNGTRLHIYEYEAPPGGTGNNANYWFGTFHLETGEWLADIEGAGCQTFIKLQVVEPGQLYALCNKVLHIDTKTGRVVREFGTSGEDVALLIDDLTLYVVSFDRTILIQDLGASKGTGRELTGAQLSESEGEVAFGTSLGLDPTGRYLYVATATREDHRNGRYSSVASKIAVIDLEAGQVVRTIEPSQPFREIAFAPNGTTAFITTVGNDISVDGLTRIDLQTGAESELLDGAISNLVIVDEE